MKQVVVTAFGDVKNLQIEEVEIPSLAANEVLINIISIGMNQADLMARRGEYRLSSGAPPFTPGIEGGGVIAAVGSAVSHRRVGQRIILTLSAPHRCGVGHGTYCSQFVADADETIPVPDGVSDVLLGALWLPFLTAWGALVWRQKVGPGDVVMLPAASSSVAIAASQIVKQKGGITIGTTTSPHKVNALQSVSAAQYDYLVVTDPDETVEPWWKTVKKIARSEGQRQGVDVIFDPVAAGAFLHHEIRLLAQGGTLWVYGLLGSPGPVDVSPLIRKDAAIRGWLLNFIVGTPAEMEAYSHILNSVANGTYQLPLADVFALDDVQAAHTAMEKGDHIGKYVLRP
ncbi:MAG: zinc-binding dehydrogenase [Cyanobacteria bacterium P01_D01_bin.105]